MSLTYTAHARYRMQHRSVTEAEVEAVLSDPDIRYTDRRSGNPVAVRTIGGRRIKVVVARDEPSLVITVGD